MSCHFQSLMLTGGGRVLSRPKIFLRGVAMLTDIFLITVHNNNFDKSMLPIVIIKPTICTNFQICFWNKTLHVSESFCVHHQEFFTVHTSMVYVIYVLLTVCEQFRPDPARKLSPNLYDIYHCRVYSEKLLMMDRGTVRNM